MMKELVEVIAKAGKQGRIAKAIRSVVKAASSKDNLKVDVEIV